ncbi:glycosyltransferase family 25 protein [Aeromonas hydrophila]
MFLDHYTTAGYVLTLAGAKKLLQCAYPLRMPSDYLTGRLQLNGLSASGVEPCCLDVDLFTTTIDDRAYGHYLK